MTSNIKMAWTAQGNQAKSKRKSGITVLCRAAIGGQCHSQLFEVFLHLCLNYSGELQECWGKKTSDRCPNRRRQHLFCGQRAQSLNKIEVNLTSVWIPKHLQTLLCFINVPYITFFVDLSKRPSIVCIDWSHEVSCSSFLDDRFSLSIYWMLFCILSTSSLEADQVICTLNHIWCCQYGK